MEIELIIHSARSLFAANMNNSSDPFVEFKINHGSKHQTKTIYNTTSPIWDDHFQLKAKPNQTLKFYVYNRGKVMFEEKIGECECTIPNLLVGERYVETMPLKSRGGYLNIYIICKTNKNPPERVRPFNVNNEQVVRFTVNAITHTHSSTRIEHIARLRIQRNGVPDQYTQTFKYASNAVLDKETFFIKGMPGECIRFIMEERNVSKWDIILEGVYLIGDFVEQ